MPQMINPVVRNTLRRPYLVMIAELTKMMKTPTAVKMQEFSKAFPTPAISKK